MNVKKMILYYKIRVNWPQNFNHYFTVYQNNIKKKADEQTINFFADTNKLKKYFSNLEFEKINSGLCKTIKFFTTKE